MQRIRGSCCTLRSSMLGSSLRSHSGDDTRVHDTCVTLNYGTDTHVVASQSSSVQRRLSTRADNWDGDQVVVPLSFVSEHVETLEEIDQEYREVAHEVSRRRPSPSSAAAAGMG